MTVGGHMSELDGGGGGGLPPYILGSQNTSYISKLTEALQQKYLSEFIQNFTELEIIVSIFIKKIAFNRGIRK